jgi:hypothetical protein
MNTQRFDQAFSYCVGDADDPEAAKAVRLAWKEQMTAEEAAHFTGIAISRIETAAVDLRQCMLLLLWSVDGPEADATS